MGGFAFTKNNKLFDYPIAEFLQQHTFYITTIHFLLYLCIRHSNINFFSYVTEI